MSILRQAIRDEIYDMDHEPKESYDGQWFFRHPKIDWQNVYTRLHEMVKEHIDTETVPEDIVIETLDEAIEQAKDEQWVHELLSEERAATREYLEAKRHPYRYRGLHQSQF